MRYIDIDQIPQDAIQDAVVFSKGAPKGFAKPSVKEATVQCDGVDIKVAFKMTSKYPAIWKRYYAEKDSVKCYDPERALTDAGYTGGYIDDGSGVYVHNPLFYRISPDTPTLTPDQIETRLRTFITVANMCAREDIVQKIVQMMPKKKNKTLYKGRTLHIAFLNIVDNEGDTYDIVARNDADTQLVIEVRSKAAVVMDVVSRNDLFTADMFAKMID